MSVFASDVALFGIVVGLVLLAAFLGRVVVSARRTHEEGMRSELTLNGSTQFFWYEDAGILDIAYVIEAVDEELNYGRFMNTFTVISPLAEDAFTEFNVVVDMHDCIAGCC